MSALAGPEKTRFEKRVFCNFEFVLPGKYGSCDIFLLTLGGSLGLAVFIYFKIVNLCFVRM